MNLTPAQKNELEVWKYFIPKKCKWKNETEEDIKMFFEWSEQGKHKDREYGDLSYFEALRQGKRWAGIHMHELYEPGVLEGSTPYSIILGGFALRRKWYQFWKKKLIHVPIPRPVVDFLKKEMFKGRDAELIEMNYQRLVKE